MRRAIVVWLSPSSSAAAVYRPARATASSTSRSSGLGRRPGSDVTDIPAYSHIRVAAPRPRAATRRAGAGRRRRRRRRARRRRARRRRARAARHPTTAARARAGWTGRCAARSSRITSPRTWRSDPSNRACTALRGPSYGGYPARRHAHAAAIGQASHDGVRAVHTVAPSSIAAALNVRAAASASGSSAPIVARSRAVDGGTGLGLAEDGARDHPAGVGVDDRMPPAERERGDRARRVRADALQREQVVELRGDLAAVALDDLDGGPVQPQRPARVAEPVPGAHGLRRRLGGEGGRRRPARDPRLPPGHDARDLGLLQHELAHEHRPGRHLGRPPRQRPRGIREPVVQGAREVEAGRHPLSLCRGGCLAARLAPCSSSRPHGSPSSAALADEILQHYGRGRMIVAIDGPLRSGKTRFADDLAAVLVEREHRVFRASMERFHRSRAAQDAYGDDTPGALLPLRLRRVGTAPGARRAVPDGRVDGLRDGGVRPGARRVDRAQVDHRPGRRDPRARRPIRAARAPRRPVGLPHRARRRARGSGRRARLRRRATLGSWRRRWSTTTIPSIRGGGSSTAADATPSAPSGCARPRRRPTASSTRDGGQERAGCLDLVHERGERRVHRGGQARERPPRARRRRSGSRPRSAVRGARSAGSSRGSARSPCARA